MILASGFVSECMMAAHEICFSYNRHYHEMGVDGFSPIATLPCGFRTGCVGDGRTERDGLREQLGKRIIALN
jgi:hypothetical protein